MPLPIPLLLLLGGLAALASAGKYTWAGNEDMYVRYSILSIHHFGNGRGFMLDDSREKLLVEDLSPMEEALACDNRRFSREGEEGEWFHLRGSDGTFWVRIKVREHFSEVWDARLG